MPSSPMFAARLLDALHAPWSVLLRASSAPDYRRRLRHPEHGRVFTLDDLLAQYAWHSDHHTRDITRWASGRHGRCRHSLAHVRTASVDAAACGVDTRRLYLGAGCASLFAYCTWILLLSEHAAYRRIEAARAARRFPVLLNELADGSMTLTTVTLLAPHLTPDNIDAVLEAARYRSKREVERQVAALAPQPDVPSSIRRHPAPAPALAASSPLLDGPTTCAHSCVTPA